MAILEGDKVKLFSGAKAWISEVLGNGDMFIAEVLTKDGNANIEQIELSDIAAKIVEVEQPLALHG